MVYYPDKGSESDEKLQIIASLAQEPRAVEDSDSTVRSSTGSETDSRADRLSGNV